MNPALSIVGRDAALPHDAPIRHGGGLDAARRRFPSAPEPWIDLSTGVSPRAYPLPAIAPEAWTRLPDENALAVLEAAAAKAYRAPARIEVVAGAGTQAFIQCLPRLLPARRVATLGFTYAEHAASWRASGARASVAATLDELADFDVAIVVNPNNPDGRLVPPECLVELARRMAPRGGVLIVDEAFVDFTPEASVASAAGGNLIVLRSFGKAYGLPGVRLGFALCEPTVARAAARGARALERQRSRARRRRRRAGRLRLARRERGVARMFGAPSRRLAGGGRLRHYRRRGPVPARRT